MKYIMCLMSIMTGLLSSNLWAQDAFSYAQGSINWANTKSEYLEGKGSSFNNYSGLGFDISKSFGTHFYGRGGVEYLSKNNEKDNVTIVNVGFGVFETLRNGFSFYGEAGLLGAGVEREFIKGVSKSASDKNAIISSQERNIYGAIGLRYSINALEFNTGYRYANAIDDLHDIKVGAAYKFSKQWALTADYTYRFWTPQQGSITSLGIKYSF